jgi:hypothetical protein
VRYLLVCEFYQRDANAFHRSAQSPSPSSISTPTTLSQSNQCRCDSNPDDFDYYANWHPPHSPLYLQNRTTSPRRVQPVHDVDRSSQSSASTTGNNRARDRSVMNEIKFSMTMGNQHVRFQSSSQNLLGGRSAYTQKLRFSFSQNDLHCTSSFESSERWN